MTKTNKKYPQLAVLLAAGLGKRLLPHTKHTPKSLLEAGGKPILSHIFHALRETDIQKVIMVTHFHEGQIISYVTERFGNLFDIKFCHQQILNGSGGALQCAADLIKKENVDYFLVTATDYQMPPLYLKSLIQFHTNGSQDVSVGLRKIKKDKVKESNITQIDQSNKIISISEKPDKLLNDDFYTAAYLTYIVPGQILDYLNRLQLSKRNEYELPDLINMMITEKFYVKGFFQDKFPEWEEKYLSE